VKLLIIGKGRMGTLIRETAIAAGDEVVDTFDIDDIDRLATVGKIADVVIDFSNPASLPQVSSATRLGATTSAGPWSRRSYSSWLMAVRVVTVLPVPMPHSRADAGRSRIHSMPARWCGYGVKVFIVTPSAHSRCSRLSPGR
jgi:hypothetical protein